MKIFNRYIKLQFLRVLLVLFGMNLLLISCNSRGESQADDPEAIRARISQYNEQINELTQEVARLENQLEQMGELRNGNRRMPVTILEMQRQPFAAYFMVNSSVEAVTAATISPEINGQIRSLAVNRGQRVKAGQEIFRLNTSVIENNIEEVRTSLQLAETVYQRQSSLWEQQIGSEIQYLEARNNLRSLQTRLQTLESQLDLAVIRSPINGIVDEIYVKEGELAMPGAPLAQVINLDQLYINADVSEAYLPLVNPNDQVILRFPAFPDYEQQVDIHRVGNIINPENRTFRVQLRISNPRERFKPNMVATIGIRSFSEENALVVPSILIKQDAQGQFVYVVQETDLQGMVARKAYVERGADSQGNTTIRSGLQEGDRVINQGHNRVSEGERVRITQR